MDEISYSGGPSRIKRKLSKRIILFGTFALFGVLLLLGLIFFITKDNSSETEDVTKSIELPANEEPEITEAPTPTPEETPTPTKVPTKAKEVSTEKGIKIAVQNGSGEAGAAASAAAILKQAGYNIISTGNADNFEYTNVTIKIKSSQKSFLSSIQKALESSYTVSETSSDLSEGQDYDALVIVGK